MILRAVMSCLYYGQVCQNVVHFSRSDLAWPQAGNDLAAFLRDVWLGGAQGIRWRQTNTCSWNEIKVYHAENPMLNPIVLPISIVGNETSGAGQQAPFMAVILRIRAGVAGRRGRGRIYVPGITTGTFEQGTITSGAITAWNQTLAQLTANFVSPSSTDFWVGIAPRNSPVDFLLAESLSVATHPGVQRRRNIGVGI